MKKLLDTKFAPRKILLLMLRFDKAVMIKLNKTKALQWQMRL